MEVHGLGVRVICVMVTMCTWLMIYKEDNGAGDGMVQFM